MKRFVSIIALSAMVFFAAAPAFSADVDAVLKKMLDAQGGKKAVSAVKDISMSGAFELIAQGLSGSATNTWKAPNKRRVDIEIMGMVITQAYDGQNAWWVNPQTGGVEDMPSEFAGSMVNDAIGFNTILDPKKFGITYSLKEKETVEGKEYIVLGMEYENGMTATLYVDPDTYLTHRTSAMGPDGMGGEVETVSISSDFRKVNGLTIAHKVVSYREGVEFMSITVEKVSINAGIDDSHFVKQ